MKKQNELIYKAIDAIYDVVEACEDADPHYFIGSCESVTSKLNRLLKES